MNWTKKQRILEMFEKEKKQKETDENYKKMMQELNIDLL